MKEIEKEKIILGVNMILDGLNCDIEHENFKETPERVARAYMEMLRGQSSIFLEQELNSIFSKSFPTNYEGIVIAPHCEAIGMCPHHLLPIRYYIDMAYIADKQALGLSKLARVAQLLAKRLVLQETLTQDILETFVRMLKPKGVMVVIRGSHGCMSYRGIKEKNSNIITSSVNGVFEEDIAARQEFLALIANGK